MLVAGEGADTTVKLSSFVADDVQAFVNGSLVAAGKSSWTRYLANQPRRSGDVLTYSQGWEPDGTASLMVLDQFDTADRSKLPARAIMDPRMATRATLYQFGTDRKIHVIQSLSGAGFWIDPKR